MSIIFNKDNKKTLYTSDSNDFEYLKEKINDKNFVKIYSEVGTSSVHMDYNLIKTLNKEKLVLMHIESMNLYNQVIKDEYKIPAFLK